MPSWRTVLILFVACVLVGVFSIFYVSKKPKKEAEPEHGENFVEDKMYSFDRTGCTRLELRGKETNIVLEKEGDDWWIVEPRRYKASKTDVDGLLSQIENLHAERILEENPKDLKVYGLDQPQLKVAWRAPEPVGTTTPEAKKSPTASAKGTPVGLKEFALLFGDKDPTESSAYVRKEGDPRVYSVGNWLLTNLNKKVEDLRDKVVLDFQQAEAKRIKLTRNGLTIDLVRHGIDQWEMAAPLNVTAAASWMNLIFANLTGMRVVKFVEDKRKGDAKYGLDRPSLAVEVVLEKDRVLPTVLFGKKTDSDYYFTKKGDPGVYTVAGTTFDNLAKSAEELRDKQMFYFDPNEAEGLTVDHGGRKLSFAKKDGHWKSDDSKHGTEETANNVLNKLKTLYADKWLERNGANLGKYGLGRPSTRIVVKLAGKNRTASLLLGEKVKGQELYYAKLGEDRWVCQVPASFRSDIEQIVTQAFAPPTPVAATPAPTLNPHDVKTGARTPGATGPSLQVLPKITPAH